MFKILRSRTNQIILLFMFFVQPIINAQENLNGNWKYVYSGGEMTIQIKGNTITIEGVSYSYKTENNNLLVYEQSTYTSYPYSINGNQLTLGFQDVSRVTFTRESGPPSGSDPLSKLIQKPGAGKSTGSSLTGKWLFQSTEGEMVLEFLSDNQLSLNGEATQYQLKTGIIQAMGDYGWVDYPYTINQGKLLITFPGGTQIPFTKTSTAVPNPQAGGTQSAGSSAGYLKGTLCSWSGSSGSSSSYSRTERISFDGNGNFTFGNESSFSGNAGIAYGGNPDARRGTYRVEEKIVILQFQSGESYRVEINMRQDNGMITELMHNGKLYARALCE
jgi:hypothetical protein